jgi:hypothetical protein
MVTNFAGQAYRPGDYEILASNGHIHTEMRDAILSVHGQQREIRFLGAPPSWAPSVNTTAQRRDRVGPDNK